MGLSYESEPVIRRLETHFGESLEIRYAMCVLVGDVRHFMIPEDMAETPELTLANYNRRLAAIYRKEEEINASAIHQLIGSSISPTLPELTTESLHRLILRHPLISPIEISQAFNLHTADEVKQFIQPLIDSGEISVQEVPHGLFVKKNIKEENEDII